MGKKGDVSLTKKKSNVKKKKPVSPKKKTIVKRIITKEDRVLEKLLIENFISMQKVMSTLVIKFDNLSSKVEGLLKLFEESARAVAEKEINLELKGDTEKQEEVLEKLKLLLDQNKLIAKGITLVHENSNQYKEPLEPVVKKPVQTGFKIDRPIVPENKIHPEGMSNEGKFSTSKNTSPESGPKVMEEEDKLPPKPSFSI